MANQQLTWVGSTVGDYTIDEHLGGGAFSWVYSGLHSDGVTRKAFKVAKPADLIEDSETGWLPTKALAQVTGAIAEVQPDTDDLLKRQGEKLSRIKTRGVPTVEEIFNEPGLTWFRMPLLSGQTLRHILKSRVPVSIETIIEMVRTLDRLSEDAAFDYHGDIKPENVLIGDDGSTTFLDPGHFGELRNTRGMVTNCTVTTPAYYPTLLPDDLFAVGLMLWEIATGNQPLSRKIPSSRIDTTNIDEDLLSMIKEEESTGKSFLSAIMTVRPIGESTDAVVAPDLEKFLMKALRLEWQPNGKLGRAEGFRSFSALAGALIALKIKGVRTLTVSSSQENS
jgi:serine/threonine protein kinase